jgi:hypothetical protein
MLAVVLLILGLVIGFTGGVVICAEFPKVFKLHDAAINQIGDRVGSSLHWFEGKIDDKIAGIGTQVVQVGQNIHDHINSVSRPVIEPPLNGQTQPAIEPHTIEGKRA